MRSSNSTHLLSAFWTSSLLRMSRFSERRPACSSCNSSFFVLTSRSYFVKMTTRGADSVIRECPCLRHMIVMVQNALRVSKASLSNFSSPASNIRPPALGISAHNLAAVSSYWRHLSKGSSPHSVELVFVGNTLIASPQDESTHDIEGFGIPWFESSGVVQKEGSIIC